MTYNGGVQSVSGFTATGLVNGETVAVLTNVSAGASATNAGTYITQASGTAGNYNLTFVDGNLVINKAALTVTGNTSNVTYSGLSQSVSGFTVSGLQGSDTVATLTNVSATGAIGLNAGSYINTVSVGSEANYVVTGSNGALNIAKANAIVTANSANVTYNGSLQSVSGFTATGLVNGETTSVLSNITAGGSGTNAGSYVAQATGSDTNYNITFVNGSFAIAKAALTVTGNSSNVTYNAANQSVNGYTVSGLQGNDTVADLVNVSAAGVTARNVGAYTNTVTVGNETNYVVTGVNGSLAIAPKAITISGITASNKTYDGNTNATVNSSNASGWIAGDSFSVTSTGVFADKNAASGQTVTLNSVYSGADVANYLITHQATTIADINKATLTAVGGKVYDGLITLTGAQLSVGGVNGETFSASGSVTMSTKNVQTNQTLASTAGLTLTGVSGSNLSNYEALALADTSVTVTPKALTLVAPSASKVYDGTTLRTTTTSDLNDLSAQLVGGDRVSAAEIVYGSKDVGTGKRVTVNLGSLVIDDGNRGANYLVGVTDSNSGVITKAPLVVSAISDAKFVTQADTVGYGGVIYNGFVPGENASVLSLGSVTRSNSATNSAGSYSGVLVPAGFSASNYEITYQAGSYSIVPAQTLLIRAGSGTTTYGTAPTYNLTAQYLATNGTIINALAPTQGAQISISDGSGGSASFNLAAVNGTYSSSNNLQVGGYNLGVSNVSITGSNFTNVTMIGALTVNPKILSNNLGVQSITKVYDGSTSITGAGLTFDRSLAGVIGIDTVALSGSGSYDDRNVGINKAVTISMGLSGTDARNYALSTTNLNANVGSITQLSSVRYIGAANGSWSDSRNWAGGALPDGNNVAQVVIPVGSAVIYNSDQVGVIGSQITNSGAIHFASANPFTFANNVSGSGLISQAGSGLLTISGNNSAMSGNLDIGNYSVTLSSINALGSGAVDSAGGKLSVTSGIVLPKLTVNGNITLLTEVKTIGDQLYNNNLTFMSSGTPYAQNSVNQAITQALPNFESTSGNISFMGTVSAGSGSKLAQRNLVVSAANGSVLFNDQVGQGIVQNRSANGTMQMISYANYDNSDVSPYVIDVQGQTIRLFADVTSFNKQQYRGSVLIGDNASNGNTRLLLSMDPSISFTGSIDDVTAGQHTLMLRALTLNSDAPTITVGDVGLTKALASLDVLTGSQNVNSYVTDISPDRSTFVGSISLVGNITTTNNQLYVGDTINLTNGTTLRSNLGTIEMITGTHGSVVGLNGVLFSFGLNATGLGSSLGTLGGRVSRDQPVQNNGITNSQHAILHSKLNDWVDKSNTTYRDSSTEAGEVQIGDLKTVNCEPNLDDNCRIN